MITYNTLHRCAKGAEIITNKYIGQAMILPADHYHYFFAGLWVDGYYGACRQHFFNVSFQQQFILTVIDIEAHEEQVLGFIHMLSHGDDIEALLCQYSRYRCHQANLVLTLDYDD